MTWDELITQAFVDIGLIQPGTSLTATLLTDGENRFNQFLSALSTEGMTAYQQVMQTFNLIAGQTNYTLGSGGTFATTGGLRAQKVTSWRAQYAGIISSGGRVLSMEEFGAAAKQQIGESSPIPAIVGADTSYPLINVRVFPPSSSTPGSLELAYFTPLSQVTNFAATITGLPEGWQQMLRSNFAVALYPAYPREGGIPPELAAAAQNSKAQIIAQNTMSTQGAQ